MNYFAMAKEHFIPFFFKREKKRYNSREVHIIKDIKNVVEMLKALMQ